MSLPHGWTEAIVDDLGEYLNGMAFKPTDWGDEGIGIIRIQNLTVPSKPLNRTKRAFEERYRIKRGDLLVSWSATLDAFIWDRDDAVLNQHIFKVTPSECVDPRFLFFQLRELISEMVASEHLHGSTMKHINRGPFLAHSAALPPLAEQRRIVAKLDALTGRLARARAELERVSVLAAKLRQSAVASAFEGRLTADWRAAHPELAALAPAQVEAVFAKVAGQERRKPAVGVDWQPDMVIPEEWRWASVDELVAITQYGSSAKTSDDATGVPVLRMGNIQRGEIDWASLKYLPPDHAEFPDLFLQAGDVLFNRTNSFELVGKSAVFRGSDHPVSYASYLIRLRCSAILPDLLVRYVNSQFGRAWVDRVASQQVGQANVNGSKLKALGVPLPPPAEQVEMLRLLDIAFARAGRLEAEAARARALLDRLEARLLAKAFRGELVPQDPDDEPAQVLLDRIRAARAAAPKAKRGRKANQSA